jgi:hypothetical protein
MGGIRRLDKPIRRVPVTARDLHQPHSSQQVEVTRHLWLNDPEHAHHFADTEIAGQ